VIDTFNGALTLNQNMFRGMRESPEVVRRGLLLVLLVGLLVGCVQAISTMITNSNPDRIIAEIEVGFDESLRQQSLAATSDEQRLGVKIITENKEAVLNLVRTLVNLPTPAPRPLSIALQSLGLALSTPLSYLSSLMLAVVLTHIAARQMGGEGNIQQMLGLGALSVAPHALDALGFIPAIGSTLSVIAWAWGLVILVLATSIAHRLDSGRATLAVLLYPTIGALLLLLGCCLFFVVTVAAGMG
jgi:hypothetical protein